MHKAILALILFVGLNSFANDWHRLADAPFGPRITSATWDPSRQSIVIFGGSACCYPDPETEVYNDTWFYNGQWTGYGNGPSSLTKRSGNILIYDPALQLLFNMFGMDCWPCVGPNSQTWYLDKATGWVGGNLGCRGPDPRYQTEAVATKDGVYIYGGTDICEVPMNDLWFYDEQFHWNELHTVNTPGKRTQFGMAYDSKRNRIILFGGWDGHIARGDTWQYDLSNNTWTIIGSSGISAITPRYGHDMVYDPIRDRIVMFGGYSPLHDVRLADTWEFDCTQDKWVFISSYHYGRPVGRFQHSMVYNPMTHSVLLFGGTRGWNVYFNDVFEYK